MKPIFFIPIRSGSKGLPDKNVLMLRDKPVIHYTLDTLIASGVDQSQIYVSSDSKEYLNISETYHEDINVVERKAELSEDGTTTFDVLSDFLENFDENQVFVLLQATSPFKKSEDITKSLSLFNQGDAHAVVSVAPLDEPMQLITEVDDAGYISNLAKIDQGYRRQAFKPHFVPNGAIYISTKKNYLDYGGFFSETTKPYIMDADSTVDLDGPSDFKRAVGIASFLNNDEQTYDVNFKSKFNHSIRELEQASDILIGDSRWVNFNSERLYNLSVNGLGYVDIISTLFESPLDLHNKQIWLTLGINDIKRHYENDETLKRIRDVIKILAEKGVRKIHIFPIIPAFYRFDINNQQVQTLNDLLKTIDSHVVTVQNPLVESLSLRDTSDGLHFKPAFETKVYNLFESVVQKNN